MNERMIELYREAADFAYTICEDEGRTGGPTDHIWNTLSTGRFAELMLAEFSDVVKHAANELAEFYTRQGATEEEILMRVNGALVVLGHIRERFKD